MTTPTPSRRRVVIFYTTTQGIRLRRRVDVFSTTSVDKRLSDRGMEKEDAYSLAKVIERHRFFSLLDRS